MNDLGHDRCLCTDKWGGICGWRDDGAWACSTECLATQARRSMERATYALTERAMHTLVRFVTALSELAANELQNRAERAHERMLREWHGSGSPQTDQERCEVLAREGVR